MPSLSSASLRARLTFLMILAGIPALGIVSFAGLQQRRHAAEEAHREAMGMARTVAADEQRLVMEAHLLLALLARMEAVREGDSATCSAFLARVLAQDDRFINFGVSRPDGELVCSVVPIAASTNIADRSYFRRAVATRGFAVGDYQVGRLTGVAGLNFGYPILDSLRQVQGVVFAVLPLTWLRERIVEAQLPEGSMVTVVDPSFTVLARYPDEEGLVGTNTRETPLAEAIRETGGQGATRRPDLDGVERLYAVTPLMDQPGTEQAFVVVGIPAEAAFREVDRALARVLGTLLLLGVLTLAAIWWGGEVFVVRPLRRLLAATQQLAAGELGARAPVGGDHDEISRLGRSFNEMADALETHVDRLERLSRVQAVLSGINSAILRIDDEDRLLREVCRIAVEQGRLRLATVHRVDGDGRAAALTAWSDAAPRGAEGPPPLPGRENGRGLVGAVLENDGPIMVRDPATDPRLEPWRELVRSRGYRSVAAIPLCVDDSPVGVLTLFAGEPDFFGEEEMRLLRELTADTSLGLQYLQAERRLEYLANYDTLTRLPNRNLFRDRLQQAVATARQSGRSLGLLAVKINRMPEINATFGHLAGDTVLREIARHLTEAVREGDTVARLGSGEFAALLADLPGPGDVAPLANDILAGVPKEIAIDDGEATVSLGIGAAIYPLDGEDAATLVQNATLARRAAASETTTTLTFFSAGIDAQAQEKRRIEHALRHAIEQGELELFYQPVVGVRSREVVGVESLVRWDSPELGAVSPGKFIPVAEETGLIRELGEWVMTTACAQGRKWHRRGFAVRINVNVSVGQLREEDFVERIERILGDYELDPHFLSLGLEITESELMENVQAIVPGIRRLREMGMAVYIDDFGTGYSSLAYLRQLPIDTLKIDTSFIRDLPRDANAVAVVTAVIAMAKGLELRVIAEGVETEEQFELLRELGCNAVQGYLFGRPGPPGEIEGLFDRKL